ncbi:MAG: hypothetical protein I3273_06295 [Candidatus Moeniiplasma glomeromycotorum]|nr:hypothetical protein [Candidatus Moeniiplasma glomeromycotorum]
MKCEYCQKDIERNQEIRINRGLLTINRNTRQRFFASAFYHQKCWLIIRQKRKQERKYFWILIITIFPFLVLVLAIFWIFRV